MRALLDVNVLIALLDAAHADHVRARDWVTRNIEHGWASCAVTQNGFVRVLSQPAYPNSVAPSTAIGLLASAAGTEHHQFWGNDVSILDANRVRPTAIHGHRQVTDAYLLSLAVAHHARFATFDSRIPLSAVPGATPQNIIVL